MHKLSSLESSRHLVPTFTVGIPTYYGGPSLVRAVESIRASRGVGEFRLIVCVDGKPLAPAIRSRLVELGVDILMAEQRGGQVARIKQMIAATDTDLLILTQDDIRFDAVALGRLVAAFGDDSSRTMVAAHIAPEPAQTLFERIVEVGVRAIHWVGSRWREGDTYLLANGRCLAFRTAAIRGFEIPEEVINSDAYLYFENRRRGGSFVACAGAVVYNKSPLHLAEHVKQHKKFEYSLDELSRYFRRDDLMRDYAVPRSLLLRALGVQFLQSPVLTLAYVVVQVYVNLHRTTYRGVTRFWDTDVSTKRV